MKEYENDNVSIIMFVLKLSEHHKDLVIDQNLNSLLNTNFVFVLKCICFKDRPDVKFVNFLQSVFTMQIFLAGKNSS